MFRKILKKILISKDADAQNLEPDQRNAAVMQAIQERSEEDPWVGVKLGSREVFERLLDSLKDDNGVHVESLLCILGALAGYACQANLRAQALAKGVPETAAFQIIETKNGKQYFFGEPLNDALAGSQYSVWSLAAGAAQAAGAKQLPDLREIFEYTASVVGRDLFGIPRVPDPHQAHDTPINFLKGMWPVILPTVKTFCPNPVDWPVLYGLAIQHAIEMGKNVIAPDMALTIVMESAVPMSKVDFANA